MFNNDPGMFTVFACRYEVNSAADIVKLVAAILPIVALFQVFDATSAVNSGILRATGRQVRYLEYFVGLFPAYSCSSSRGHF